MNSLCASCRAHALKAGRRSVTAVPAPSAIRAFSTTLPASAANKAQIEANKKAKAKAQLERRKKKKHNVYQLPNLGDINRYTLVDAMQYIRAFEIGRNPAQVKYDVAIRLRTKKDGPVLRNQIRLPNSVKTDIKVCVLVPVDSKAGKAAKAAGASLVGEEEVFDIIKNGKIDFDRCITTPDMLSKLTKAGLPRILGPRGLMPSVKLNSVIEEKDMQSAVRNMMGGSTYRERQGVIRMAIGQLGFTEAQLRDNVQALIAQLRREASAMVEQSGFSKDIYDVVLSSTNSPAFSLNGDFSSPNSTLPQRESLPNIFKLAEVNPKKTKIDESLLHEYQKLARKEKIRKEAEDLLIQGRHDASATQKIRSLIPEYNLEAGERSWKPLHKLLEKRLSKDPSKLPDTFRAAIKLKAERDAAKRQTQLA